MGSRAGAASDPDLGLAAVVYKPIKPAQLFRVLVDALSGGGESSGDSEFGSSVGQALAEQLPLRILVAEDNAINQKVVLRLLERLGYRADVAANGIEALEAIERQAYDVILMDVQMPEMDGIEAARRIFQRFERHEAPRVIAMTANVLQGDRELALAAGMEGFLSKPIELTTLRQALLGLADRPPRAHAPSLRIVDTTRLEELAALEQGGAVGVVRELIDLFLADAPGHISRLWSALHAHDGPALRAVAHRLLSSVENLGARRMAELCTELERCGRTSEIEAAPGILTALGEEFDRVKKVLETERLRY
jgi:CheY-like chemotaxis protein